MPINWKEPPGIVVKIILWFLGICGLLILTIVSLAWAKVEDTSNRVEINANRVNELEKIVPVVQTQYTDIVRRLGNIETKIDKNGGGR